MWTYHSLVPFVCIYLAASTGADSDCTDQGGACQTDTLRCSGHYQDGLCSGANRRCCVASSCQSNDMLQVQEQCREQNSAHLAAEAAGNKTEMCRLLIEVLECVAENVPTCFHQFMDMYKQNFHSPHFCVLRPEKLLRLQQLVAGTADTKGDEDVNVNGGLDVDILPLSSQSTPTEESSSWSTAAEGGDGAGGGGGGEEAGGDEKEGDANKNVVVAGDPTGTHKHTGNGASSISRQCGLSALVVSWLVGSRLTSYLLS